MTKRPASPDWELLLAHAAALQTKVPGAVLVGGTAAALHAGHRVSFVHDHVVRDLGENYDAALAALESIAGWRTRRKIRSRLVLGKVGAIEAGLRHLRRSAPLETTTVKLRSGATLTVPTVAEALRIKAFLLVERNATRDYLDVALDRRVTLVGRRGIGTLKFWALAADKAAVVCAQVDHAPASDGTSVEG